MPAPIDTLETIYEAVKEKVDLQLGGADSLDSKAAVVLGIDGVIASIVFNLFPKVFVWLFVPGLLLLLSAIWYSFWAYRIVPYRRDPEPRALAEYYMEREKAEVLGTLIANLVESYEFNTDRIKHKAGRINFALWLTFAGMLLLTGSVLMGGKNG